jgi:hypothetical protein
MMPILKMIREYARGPLVEELLLKSTVFASLQTYLTSLKTTNEKKVHTLLCFNLYFYG